MTFWNDDACVQADKELLMSTFDATMDVYYFETWDIDEFAEENECVLYEDIPCGISYLSSGYATDDDFAKAETVIKVFCPEDVDIPVGAVLYIDYYGQSLKAVRTGNAKHYLTHREFTAVVQSI